MKIVEAIAFAVEKVKAWVNENKQDKLTGTAGQVVGFDANGKPVAQEAPSGGSNIPTIKQGGDTLTWDGNTEGLVSVNMGLDAYKVSDAVLTSADLANGFSAVYRYNGVTELGIDAAKISVTDDEGLLSVMWNTNGGSEKNLCMSATKEVFATFDMDLPSGTYIIVNTDGYMCSLTIPGYTGFGKEVIDPAFLPEHLQFGEGESETVILEEQELAYDANEGGCVGMISAKVNAGDVLTVKYDGTDYKCEAAEMQGMVIFGNLGLVGADDTGEPFIGLFVDGLIMIQSADEANHTVGISTKQVEKLNAKYVDCQRQFFVNSGDTYLYNEVTCATKVTREELLKVVAKMPFIISFVGVQFYLPLSVAVAESYAEVVIQTGDDLTVLHTAEYTAE